MWNGSAWVAQKVAEAQLNLTDVTTANVSTTAHGLAPKLPNDATKYLDGTGAYSVPAGAGGGSMTLICDSKLSGAQASFDTNTILGGNISGSYKDLLLLVSGAVSVAGPVDGHLTINNDTGANYDWFGTRYNNASLSGLSSFAAAYYYVGAIAGTNEANRDSAAVIYFLDYASTTFYKRAEGNFSHTGATTGASYRDSLGGLWRNTVAITRLAVTPSSGNFVAGSRFTLYGLS